MRDKTEEFFKHEEECPNCKPFDLCPIGSKLMMEAAAELRPVYAKALKTAFEIPPTELGFKPKL